MKKCQKHQKTVKNTQKRVKNPKSVQKRVKKGVQKGGVQKGSVLISKCPYILGTFNVPRIVRFFAVFHVFGDFLVHFLTVFGFFDRFWRFFGLFGGFDRFSNFSEIPRRFRDPPPLFFPDEFLTPKILKSDEKLRKVKRKVKFGDEKVKL